MSKQIDVLKSGVPALLSWYNRVRRPLPFREAPTPYRVWVSEIMLQQTRIEAVLPHFAAFMAAFPTVSDLANADDEHLLKLWEGLGYYSRAKNLKKAAIEICKTYGGELPADFEQLRALSGIGDYTAGAIASIAYGLPVPAVDGNVLRVFSRLLCYDTDVLSTKGRRELTEAVKAVLPPDAPGAFNEAVMELGETVCLPNTAPLCDSCPLAAVCAAHNAGRETDFPVRIKKNARRVENRTVLVAIQDKKVLLCKRPEKGLLAGLYELPNIEGAGDANALAAAFGLTLESAPQPLPYAKHLFSHVEWRMTGFSATVSGNAPANGRFVTAEELKNDTALPSAFKVYGKLLPALLEGQI